MTVPSYVIKMAANVSSGQPFLQNLRAMFYLVTPGESMYQKMEDVPNFVDNVSTQQTQNVFRTFTQRFY